MLDHHLARLLTLAAFRGTGLQMLIVGERLARFGALVAGFRTAIRH